RPPGYGRAGCCCTVRYPDLAIGADRTGELAAGSDRLALDYRPVHNAACGLAFALNRSIPVADLRDFAAVDGRTIAVYDCLFRVWQCTAGGLFWAAGVRTTRHIVEAPMGRQFAGRQH